MKWREFTTGFSKKPPEEQGILDSITDTAKDAYEWARDNTAAQTRLLLGMGTEAFGKALNFLGDEDTIAAKYNPSVASTLRSAGDSANNLARGLLTSAADIAPVADYDSPVGAFANQVTGAVHGGIGRMASMLHLDQTADAGYNAAQKTANTAPVSTDDLVEYFTNPRGFISDTGQLVGSMATIVPFMGLLPEATAARGLAALGGDTLVQGLVNRGMYGLAKFFASSMPRAVQYGLTSAPIEGAMEGGETRRELLNRGASEEEATRESLIAMGKNVPLLVASNTLEGLSFFSPLRAGNKAVQIGGRGLLNSLQQQYEEFVQQGIQNEALGEPSGWLPWNGAPNQYEAAERVRYPSLLMGGAGGAIQAYAGDDRQDNWERGSQEKISVGDYSTRANKSANSLALDNFMQAIGQQESDGNYDLTNPDSGAAGKFQIMPDNWSSWAQDAGLSPDAPMTPENQELVARNKMQQYYNKFGNWRDVAIAWYGGEGAVSYSEEAKNRPQYSNGNRYPSINEYADSVMARFENFGGEVETSNASVPQWQQYLKDKQNKPQNKKNETPKEAETPKPLFDLNSEDSTTQKLLEQFANERFESAIKNEDGETADFFNSMFDDDSKFQDTPENRQAIATRYGDELDAFVQKNSQPPPQQKTSETKAKAKQERSYDKNTALIQTGRKYLDELLKKGDEPSRKTAWTLNSAIQNNDLAKVENILTQKLSPNEKKIKIASAQVKTGNKGKKSRQK